MTDPTSRRMADLTNELHKTLAPLPMHTRMEMLVEMISVLLLRWGVKEKNFGMVSTLISERVNAALRRIAAITGQPKGNA